MNKITIWNKYNIKKFIKFIKKLYFSNNQKIDEKDLSLLFYLFFVCYKSRHQKINFSDMEKFYLTNKLILKSLFLFLGNKEIFYEKNNLSFAHLKKYLNDFDYLINIEEVINELKTWNFLLYDYFFILNYFYPHLTYLQHIKFMESFLINFFFFYKQNLKFKIDSLQEKIKFKLYLESQYTFMMQIIFKNNFNDLYVLSNSLMPWEF